MVATLAKVIYLFPYLYITSNNQISNKQYANVSNIQFSEPNQWDSWILRCPLQLHQDKGRAGCGQRDIEHLELHKAQNCLKRPHRFRNTEFLFYLFSTHIVSLYPDWFSWRMRVSLSLRSELIISIRSTKDLREYLRRSQLLITTSSAKHTLTRPMIDGARLSMQLQLFVLPARK
jgi:hypothetical protein